MSLASDLRRARPRRTLPLALALATAAGFANACAGEDATGSTSPRKTAPSADEELSRMGDVVAALRGRTFDYRVGARTMSCSMASARLLEIARLEGARCTQDVEHAIEAVGFVEGEPPANVHAHAGTTSRDSNEGSGPCGLAFYDQIRKEVIVVEGRSSSEERSEVLAHELSHALQDQLFDLRAKLRTIPRTASDDHDAEELAANATLNEGEATAVELLYLWKRGDERSWIQGIGLEDPLADGAALCGSGLGLRQRDRTAAGLRAIKRGADHAWLEQRRFGARSYYHALARFQYLVGASFIADAYARGGWTTVDRLRSSPPTTTAELLHPERYFGHGAAAERVTASDLAKTGGFRVIYENRLGELGTSVITESECPGWRGDRYRVLERASDGSTVVEARFVLEDTTAAATLVTALPRWLKAIHVAGGTVDFLERRGRAVVSASGLTPAELGDARRALWNSSSPLDPVAAIGVTHPTDGALLLRQRNALGQLAGELRILESGERARVEDVLASHFDAKRNGTIETDGHSFGLRSRPGGGFSWAEERADGRFVVATAPDRESLTSLRAAACHLLQVKAPETPRVVTTRTPSAE